MIGSSEKPIAISVRSGLYRIIRTSAPTNVTPTSTMLCSFLI